MIAFWRVCCHFAPFFANAQVLEEEANYAELTALISRRRGGGGP